MVKGVLLSMPRSGTELCVRALNTHPQIRAYSEILGKSRRHEQWRFMNTILEDSACKAKVRLCKVFQHHMTPITFDQLIKSGFYIIYLERDNIVRQHISWYIKEKLEKTESIRFKHLPYQDYKISLNINWLLTKISETQKQMAFIKERLQKRDHVLYLKYTDIVGKEGNEIVELPQKVNNKICEFFDIKPYKFKVDYRKQTPYQLKDIIANYKIVKEILRKNKLNF